MNTDRFRWTVATATALGFGWVAPGHAQFNEPLPPAEIVPPGVPYGPPPQGDPGYAPAPPGGPGFPAPFPPGYAPQPPNGPAFDPANGQPFPGGAPPAQGFPQAPPRQPSPPPGLPAGSVTQVAPESLVTEIRIEGNQYVKVDKIQPLIRLRKNRPFDVSVVESDVRALLASRLFVSVKPLYEQTPQGVTVVYRVTERPVFTEVAYLGNEKLKEKKLAKETGLAVGDPVDPSGVADARRKLEELYRGKGFNQVQIQVLEGDNPQDRRAVFQIHEGPRQRVMKVSFVGHSVVSEERLRTIVSTKPVWFWRIGGAPYFWKFGGEYEPDKVTEDVEKLLSYYHGLGYWSVRVGREITNSPDGEGIFIQFVIDEGPRYAVREIAVVGNQKFPTSQILADMKLKAGMPFDQSQLEFDVNKLKDLYGGAGHIYADIQPDVRFLEEPAKLDIVYQVDEGARYRVGRINVYINGEYPHTKITTVLNRISLRPGDVVDVTELRNSERRLRAAQLFRNDPSRGIQPKIVFGPPDVGKNGSQMAERSGGSQARGQDPGLPLPQSGGPAASTVRWEFDPRTGTWTPHAATAPQAPLNDPQAVDVNLFEEVLPPAPATEDGAYVPPRDLRPAIRPLPQLDPRAFVDPRACAVPAEALPQPYWAGYAAAPPAAGVPSAVPSRAVPEEAPLVRAQGGDWIAVGASDWVGPWSGDRFAEDPQPLPSARLPSSASPLLALREHHPAADGLGRSAMRGQSPGSRPLPTSPGPAMAPYYGDPGDAPVYRPMPPNGNPVNTLPPGGIPYNGESVPPGQPVGVPGGGGYAPTPAPPMLDGVSPQEDWIREPVQDFDVYVEETETGRFMFGVGVNSDAGVVGNIVIDEQNFDWTRPPRSWADIRNGTAWRGGGQRFRLEAAPGSQVSRYVASWTDPYFLDTWNSLSLSASYYERIFQDWDEQRVSGRIAVGRQITPDLTASFATRVESVDISNPRVPTPPELAAAVGKSNIVGFRVGLIHDTRDSAFLPTEGHFIDMNFEQVIGDFNYPRGGVEMKQYFLMRQRPDGSGRHTLSFKGELAVTGSDTPIYDNYFAGGFTTIRGYTFRGASPRDMGVIVGGEFMLLGSVEYCMPVTADDMFKVVAFCDTGTVEQDVRFDPDNFRIAPGVGLRVTVPAMGPAPIAVDFAFPIRSAPGDDEQVFNFYIGATR